MRYSLQLVTVVSLLSAGCSGPVVRDGIWELSFTDVKRRMIGAQGMPDADMPPPRKLVRLQLLGPGGGQEIAIVTHLVTAKNPAEPEKDEDAETTPRETALKPMRLRILYREDEPVMPPTVRVEHEDAYWIWSMWGTVPDPQTMIGSYFSARGRYKTNLALEGKWNLRWIREE